MLLSYWLRLACLALFCVGVMQVTLHLLLRFVMPLAEKSIDQMTVRLQERVYFVAPIASHMVALLLTLLVVMPQYIRDETNSLQERVGIVCVAGALVVALRYLYLILRAVQLLLQMWRAHRRDNDPIVLLGGTPVHISAERYPLLAVTGLFSPRIVLSQHLLGNAAFSPQLLEIALAHENAHVRHHDNLKHFVLASLALSRRTMKGPLQRWRYAAENAADDEAVSGSSSRAILLAETLLVAARAVPPQPASALSLTLLPHEEELDKRIDRLLRNDSALAPTMTPSWRQIVSAGAFLLASTCALLHLFAASFHEVAEYVLHIG
jgi:Zn-dependent protease with chaperone function